MIDEIVQCIYTILTEHVKFNFIIRNKNEKQ